MSPAFRNVALIGASGNLGSEVLNILLTQGKHNITVVTRAASKATFPSTVNVCRGELTDGAFLEATFKDQDIVVSMLAFAGLKDENHIIEAAAQAGVKNIVPSEWGASSRIQLYVDSVPFVRRKLELQKKIVSLGMRYFVVVTNPWIDYCLKYGIFDINPVKRTAVLYTDSIAFNTTTTPRIGAAVAKFLALPKDSIDQHIVDNRIYVSSFQLTQPEIFQAVLHATKTCEADWTIERKTVADKLFRAQEILQKDENDLHGNLEMIFGVTYKAGDYTASLQDALFGFAKEDLADVTRSSIANFTPVG